MPRSSDTFSTLTHFLGVKQFFSQGLKLLIYVEHLVLVVQIIKNVIWDHYYPVLKKTSLSEHWVNVPKFGQYIYFALFVWSLLPVTVHWLKFGHFLNQTPDYILKVKCYMNKIKI